MARRGRRKRERGREEKWIVNIFRELLYDVRTGKPMGVKTSIDRRFGKAKRQARLIPRDDGGGSSKLGFNYDAFEHSFLKWLAELNPADFTLAGREDADRLASLSSGLVLVGEKIETTQSVIHETTEPKSVRPLLKMLTDLEQQKDEIKKAYDELRMRLTSPVVESIADTQTLAGLLAECADPDALRLKIRARLRQFIDKIYIVVYDTPGQIRRAWAQAIFHDGTYRHFFSATSLTRHPVIEDGTAKMPDATFDLRSFNLVDSPESVPNVMRLLGEHLAKAPRTMIG